MSSNKTIYKPVKQDTFWKSHEIGCSIYQGFVDHFKVLEDLENAHINSKRIYNHAILRQKDKKSIKT